MRNAGIFALAVVLALGVVAVIPTLVLAEGETVVVTRPGVVFHTSGSNDFRGRGVERSIGAAINAGYTPCRVCFGKNLGSLPSHTPEIGTGAPVASFTTTNIPAPPVSTVTQPFGVRLPSSTSSRIPKGGVRNPYENPRRPVTLGEQGAFETH